MARYYRRNRARQLALRDQMLASLPSSNCTSHTPITVTDLPSSGQWDIVIDEGQELRCSNCSILLGFPA